MPLQAKAPSTVTFGSVVFWNGVSHALTATVASAAARHRQIDPGFVDKFKPLGRQLDSIPAI